MLHRTWCTQPVHPPREWKESAVGRMLKIRKASDAAQKPKLALTPLEN